jgi:Na+/proline symporter
MLQCSFSGKSVRHASRGLILAALMTGPLTLSFIIPGICGSMMFSGEGALAKADAVLPTLLHTVLPIGLGGLIIAALVAASNSTASALLNSLATLSEHDFYRRFVPEEAPASKHYSWVNRVATLVGGLIGLILASQLYGRYVPKADPASAYYLWVVCTATLVGGLAGYFLASSVYQRLVPKEAPASTHYLWIGRMATLVGGLIGLVFAFNVERLGGIIQANFKIMAFFEPPIFVVVAAALFWRRTHWFGSTLAIVCGIAFSAFTLLWPILFSPPVVLVGEQLAPSALVKWCAAFTDADRAIWAFPICTAALIAGTYLGELIWPRTEEHKKTISDLAARIRGIKPDFGSRVGVAGIAVAAVSLIAFVICAFAESALPKPGNILIFMSFMMLFVVGCYMATYTFVPDEKEGLEEETSALGASWTHRIMGSGWTWLGVYVFAILMVIAVYVLYEPAVAASDLGPTLPVGPAVQ